LDGLRQHVVSQLVTTASEELNPNTAASFYAHADTELWEDMVALPLYFEPTALVWSGAIAGVTPMPCSQSLLWYAQFWTLRGFDSSTTTPSPRGTVE
jgi:ABC-type transport system substrate-binding protein